MQEPENNPITCVCVMSYRAEPSIDHVDVATLVSEMGEDKTEEVVAPIARGEVHYIYDADGEGDYLLVYYCIPEQRESLRTQATAAGITLS